MLPPTKPANPLASSPLALLLAGLFALGLFPGCGQKPAAKPAAAAETAVEEDGTNVVDEIGEALEAKLAERRRAAKSGQSKPKKPQVAAAPARTPSADEQWCFQCEAKGSVPCRAEGCKVGYLPCPGSCVRPGKGTWVPYTPLPGQLGYKMPLGGGKYAVISPNHVGEVWVVRNGEAVSLGPCPTCKGNMKVPCTECGGTARVTCGVCKGATVIPAKWKPTDNPWFNAQPDIIRLKDGRVILGKEAGGDGETVMLKTRDGQIIKVPKTEIVSPTPQ